MHGALQTNGSLRCSYITYLFWNLKSSTKMDTVLETNYSCFLFFVTVLFQSTRVYNPWVETQVHKSIDPCILLYRLSFKDKLNLPISFSCVLGITLLQNSCPYRPTPTISKGVTFWPGFVYAYSTNDKTVFSTCFLLWNIESMKICNSWIGFFWLSTCLCMEKRWNF